MIYKPYDYQRTATQWIVDHPRCGLFLDMGLGKTVSTLTALRQLMDDGEVSRTLVIAPKKVAETTWTTEAQKWRHLRSLRVAKVMGTEAQRVKALEEDADVWVIGRDNFVWLMERHKGQLPFDVMVIDELTSFKSHSSRRFKAMRMATPQARRVIGLTGTPAPNGLIDLWGQLYCLDMGERLGRFVTRYREAYFNVYTRGNIPIRIEPKRGAEEAIRKRIGDICLSMQAKDYLTLPDMLIHDVKVELSAAARKAYDSFERDQVLEFEAATADDTPAALLASSAAALMGKLAQMANGAVYDSEGGVVEVHSEKLDRLAELVEAAGSPVLVFYQYRHDIPRIMSRLKGRRVAVYQGERDLLAWNRGEIDVLLAHPASTAYGLNMQQGGHYIVWFGTGWDLELFQQANARLHRQGQRHPVTVYLLLGAGTVDERAAASLRGKGVRQQSLLESLSYLRRKHHVE